MRLYLERAFGEPFKVPMGVTRKVVSVDSDVMIPYTNLVQQAMTLSSS